jgi:hypothetical protein
MYNDHMIPIPGESGEIASQFAQRETSNEHDDR